MLHQVMIIKLTAATTDQQKKGYVLFSNLNLYGRFYLQIAVK
jgi:hypothetical protein